MSIPRTCALFSGWKASRTQRDIQPPQTQKTGVNSFVNNSKMVQDFDYSAFFHSEIQRKKQDSTYRVFKRVLRDADHFPFADDYSTGSKRRVVIWCSNDYLGMSWHPKVREAAM